MSEKTGYFQLLNSRPFAESMREGRTKYNQFAKEFKEFHDVCRMALRSFGEEINKTLVDANFEVVEAGGYPGRSGGYPGGYSREYLLLQICKQKKKNPIPILRIGFDKLNIKVATIEVVVFSTLTKHAPHDIDSFINELKGLARNVLFIEAIAQITNYEP